jgi:hypothetical protein
MKAALDRSTPHAAPSRRNSAAVLNDNRTSNGLGSLSQSLIDSSPAIAAQRKAFGSMFGALQRKGEKKEKMQLKSAGSTGSLPGALQSGMESLSGISMDDVKVHYNSSEPAQLNAHAFAQGSDIHLGPGQERHLPHEAWHVVQQAEGRVRPTAQMKDRTPINDDAGLEREADIMGAKALQAKVDKKER